MPTRTELSITAGIAVVIEDDLDVRDLVCAVLQQAGFDVHSSATGREGVDVVRDTAPTIVTLDVGLPDIDGHEVLRRIRDISDCYVIMLTAQTDELDILTALQSGADDYLTKPFRPRELRARVHTLLRRPRDDEAPRILAAPRPDPSSPGSSSPNPSDASPVSSPGILTHGDLVLNPENRTAHVSGQKIPLNTIEFDLLHELLRHHGTVLTRSSLVNMLRGNDQTTSSHVSDVDNKAMHAHIGKLRRKLSHHLHTTELIITVRGVGYRIASSPHQNPDTTALPLTVVTNSPLRSPIPG